MCYGCDIASLRSGRCIRCERNRPGCAERFAESSGFRWPESFRTVDIPSEELRGSQANATDNLLICR